MPSTLKKEVRIIEEAFDPRYDTDPPSFDEAFESLKTEQGAHVVSTLQELKEMCKE